jgi:hypothetical protein
VVMRVGRELVIRVRPCYHTPNRGDEIEQPFDSLLFDSYSGPETDLVYQ